MSIVNFRAGDERRATFARYKEKSASPFSAVMRFL